MDGIKLKELRILLVDNLMIRRYGNLRMGPGRKLMCGAIRNNWRLCEFSDRDMARLLAPFGIRAWGGAIANRKLVKCAENFRPDLVLLGHCDYISNDTLCMIRRILPGVKIAHFNVDPLWQEGTRRQMEERRDSCDALFATTAGEMLAAWKTPRNIVAYMPNPSDPSMEHGDNSLKTLFERDLFYAANPRKGDERLAFLAGLRKLIDGRLRADYFGIDTPSVWGAKYEHILSSSKMSVNLNRREGDKWYSSDRIAHLMGYGILTFLSSRGEMERFFTPDEAVFFDSPADLAEKILRYNADDEARMRTAAAGRRKYHALFNGARVLKYMVETVFGLDYSEPYEWAEETYR